MKKFTRKEKQLLNAILLKQHNYKFNLKEINLLHSIYHKLQTEEYTLKKESETSSFLSTKIGNIIGIILIITSPTLLIFMVSLLFGEYIKNKFFKKNDSVTLDFTA